MDDSNQIEVPPTFLALHADAAGRLREPVARVRQRYELCEDLAQMLTEQAAATLHERGMTEQEVLRRIYSGLAAEDSPVPPAEAQWVVSRLAELLGWPMPVAL